MGQNFEGANSLVHPDTTPSDEQTLERVAENLSDMTDITVETTNGPTPDADRSRHDSVQTFQAVSTRIGDFVSGTVAQHTDGRWLVWF